MSTSESTNGQVEVQISGLPLNVPVVVTEQIGAATGATAPGTGAPSAVIERQLRNILGWTPKPADTAGLVRALGKSFSSYEDKGMTRWLYTPRGTAIPLEAAEITGAQGSLYLRAAGAVDDMLLLLDGLEPMRQEAADEDAVRAISAIVRSTLSEIVAEVGREGGPSVPLVDSLFVQLLGDDESDGDIERLRDRFYFDRRFISGLADESNFTKFLTFADYATSLGQSWEAQRAFFDGSDDNAPPFFGPQLTKLHRILETVGQNVEAVFVALDSVGIDQTERHTLETGSLFLQPTLDWVQGYVAETAPRLVDEAGVDGARALLPNLAAMADAIDTFIPPVEEFPTLYNTPLVFATLQSLQRGLAEAAEIVDQIEPAPGAHRIELENENLPYVGLPEPDDTEPPPLVVTASGVLGRPGATGATGAQGPAGPQGPVGPALHHHYHVHIDDPKGSYVLQNPGNKQKYPGVVSEHEGVYRCDFDFDLGREPAFYNLMFKPTDGTWRKLMTIPTSQASPAGR